MSTDDKPTTAPTPALWPTAHQAILAGQSPAIPGPTAPPQTEKAQPPVPKYELTITISGNSHEEIERELLVLTRGGYLLDSDYHKRDEFHVTGGRGTRILRHTNPDMTPERYDAELDAWWSARKEARRG